MQRIDLLFHFLGMDGFDGTYVQSEGHELYGEEKNACAKVPWDHWREHSMERQQGAHAPCTPAAHSSDRRLCPNPAGGTGFSSSSAG